MEGSPAFLDVVAAAVGTEDLALLVFARRQVLGKHSAAGMAEEVVVGIRTSLSL
jgi:hypothetical protein